MMMENFIQGVEIQNLKLVNNTRGYLMEVQRSDDTICPGFGQAYITSTFPGIVKAWYRHHHQIDQIALIKGVLLLVLFDDRAESPSYGLVQEIKIEEHEPKLVQIPTGVWHGFQSVGEKDAILLHLNSIPFSHTEIDEDRLAFDSSEIPYTWK